MLTTESSVLPSFVAKSPLHSLTFRRSLSESTEGLNRRAGCVPDLKFPCIEEPLRYVNPIPVALAPALERYRINIVRLRQAQVFNLQVELGWKSRDDDRLAPVGISASRHGYE